MAKAKTPGRKSAEPLIALQLKITQAQLDLIDHAKELSGLRFRTEYIVGTVVTAAKKKVAEISGK